MAKNCTDEEMHSRYRKMRVDGKQVCVHRHVMEQIIGRPLEFHEHVHHINGNRYDNRPENLQLVTPTEHYHSHDQSWRQSQWYRDIMSAAGKGKNTGKRKPMTQETKNKLSESSRRARKEKFWSTKSRQTE
jgi:hypothetical protein